MNKHTAKTHRNADYRPISRYRGRGSWAGPSAKRAYLSTPPQDEVDLTDRQFTPRFNSFLKQIPSTLHSVSKPGSFSYFFLGSACAIKNSELWAKLKLEDLHFSLSHETKRLTLVVRQNEPSKVKVFIIDSDASLAAKPLASDETKKICQHITDIPTDAQTQ